VGVEEDQYERRRNAASSGDRVVSSPVLCLDAEKKKWRSGIAAKCKTRIELCLPVPGLAHNSGAA
jgi:hypothetical protein